MRARGTGPLLNIASFCVNIPDVLHLDVAQEHGARMVTTAERDEQSDVRVMLEAFLIDAHYSARLTQGFVRVWSKALGMDLAATLPAEFLTELSAVIRIASWQLTGLESYLGADLPSWRMLFRELLHRLAHAPETFGDDPTTCAAPLARRVMKFWFTRFSWCAPLFLGVDMVARRPDSQVVLEALAELLWHGRHLVSRKDSTDE